MEAAMVQAGGERMEAEQDGWRRRVARALENMGLPMTGVGNNPSVARGNAAAPEVAPPAAASMPADSTLG